jgi:heterodisulfide reductase subunit C
MAMFDKPIRVSELDPSFKAEVIAHEAARDITACFSCGTCTAGCPIHEAYPEYDPRKMARMVNLGMRERVLSSPYIWYCATCHTCEQRCPQNVKFFSVLNVLKNMAAKEGCPPPMSINEDMYSGCGICVAPCPSAAISVNLFEDGQLFSRIEAPVA